MNIGGIISTVIVIMLIIAIYYLISDQYGYYGKAWLKTYVGPDGIKYSVHSAYSDSDQALAALIRVQQRNIQLIRYLKKIQRNDIRTQRLLRNYNPDNLKENSPNTTSGDTAYVVERGKEFRMCLRPRDMTPFYLQMIGIHNPQPVYGDNELSFVQVHEMAHLASSTYDHDQEFWQNFKWMLEQAVPAGIYKTVNYEKYPFNYCGLDVNYNPLYDDDLPDSAM